MQPLAQKGYSDEQVRDVLHAKSKARNVRFRYDLLDKNLNYKRTLTNVLDGEIAFSAFASIKRTAKFTIKEETIPAHVERGTRTVNYYTGPQSNVPNLRFNSWTHTNTEVINGECRLIPRTSGVDNSTMESGWRTVADGSDKAHGMMAGGWVPWDAGNPRPRMGQGGGWQGAYAQEVVRETANQIPVGVQNWNYPVTASGGQKLYVSFFYRLFNSEVHPNYVYAMSAAGNVYVGTNITTTATGYNNWYRWEGETTIPAGRQSASYCVLVGCDSNVNNGICNYDNVYLGTSKAIYAGVATSPVLDMSNDVYQGIDIPKVKGVRLEYENIAGSPTREGSWFPENKVSTRYSTDGGKTWSSWVATNDYSVGWIPSGTDARNLRVQLMWSANRFSSDDNVRLQSINVRIEYEEDTLIPKQDVINYLSDRIQPCMEVEMPDGQWLTFPLGVFLLNSPTRTDRVKGVYRDVEAYDQLVILQEDKILWNRTFYGGIVEEIESLLISLGISRKCISITPSNKSGVLTFPIGTPLIKIVNDMLAYLSYTPLWVDANGVFRASPYVLPSDRPSEYTYQDDELSVTYNGMDEELDVFNTANYWIVVQTNVEKAPLKKIRANNDPLSPLSTVSLGRRIVDYREVDNLATQAEVDAYAERLYQETTMAYSKIKFKTALMPLHEYQDCIRVRYAELDIDDRYIETSWNMQLRVGGDMEHEARKVVKV